MNVNRRTISVAAVVLAAATAIVPDASAQDRIILRMSTPASETDQRSVALATDFAPAVAEFAD